MKTVKRTTIAILILTLLFSMAIPAMAYDLTIDNDVAGHTYTAYQIFAGDMSKNGLVDIVWGTGIDGEAFLAALQDSANKITGLDFSTCKTASDVAVAIKGASKTTMNAFANLANGSLNEAGAYTTSEKPYTMEVPEGYYFIKDSSADLTAENDAKTLYILKVTDNTKVTPKTAYPTVVKKVEEDTNVDGYTALDDNYNDVADWDIGEEKSFRLYAEIPEDDVALGGYNKYKIVFHDTYSEGITVDETGFVAEYRVGNEVKSFAPDAFEATYGDGTITYTCTDLISAMDAGDFLKNPTVVITYKATLNENAKVGTTGNPNEVYLEFSNDAYSTGTGYTPSDEAIVFTYVLNASKVDGEDTTKKLQGAEFILKNKDGQFAVVENGIFQNWDAAVNATTLISDANGVFTIKGLDADTYFLEETSAPAGYNKLAGEIELTITATKNNGTIFTQNWNGDAVTSVDLSGKGAEGDTVTIANFSGFTLPETGGLGTTLIYTIGGILVIGVSVILITRKRMSNQD